MVPCHTADREEGPTQEWDGDDAVDGYHLLLRVRGAVRVQSRWLLLPCIFLGV
jgi:hypothetical protein